MLTERRGDILTSNADIICHQVNCKGVMGAGLAKQIRAKYPEVYQQYCTFCASMSPAKLLGCCQIVQANDGKQIANLFGQLSYGVNKVQTDYTALKNAMQGVSMVARQNKLSVAIPYGIGCGLAGGDWSIVKDIIENAFTDVPDVTIWRL